MRRWYDQNKPLYPGPVQWRKGAALSAGMTCLLFAHAGYIWLNKIDPCSDGSSKWCKLAEFWSHVTGVERYLADAQAQGAFGLMMAVIACQLWRHRAST